MRQQKRAPQREQEYGALKPQTLHRRLGARIFGAFVCAPACEGAPPSGVGELARISSRERTPLRCSSARVLRLLLLASPFSTTSGPSRSSASRCLLVASLRSAFDTTPTCVLLALLLALRPPVAIGRGGREDDLRQVSSRRQRQALLLPLRASLGRTERAIRVTDCPGPKVIAAMAN